MRERPILFSTEMVRAILEGRKTQARRIVKAGTRDDWNACSYGVIGDRFWVRETWRTDASLDRKSPRLFTKWPVEYQADGCRLEHGALYGHTDGKWRPSIFMPRWASRITLEITGVRVERLRDITEEDAIAEGVLENGWEDSIPGGPICTGYVARHSFESLWNKINRKRASWESNPWVWVIEFKRAEVAA